jgi:hypothetical protein
VEPILSVRFFRTLSGNEPVREWLKSLRREERKIIGEGIKTVQFGWPLGMPLVRKLICGRFARVCPIVARESSSPPEKVGWFCSTTS